MPRVYSEIPIDGGLDWLKGAGARTHNELQNVYTRLGHLRRRPGLVSIGPTSTPGTAGPVRAIVDHQHDSGSITTATTRPDTDTNSVWTPSSGTDVFAMLDETTADGDTTYATTVTTDKQWLNFTAVAGLAAVNKITIYITAKLVDLGGGGDYDKLGVYTSDDGGSTAYLLGHTSYWKYDDGYAVKSIESTTNPVTGAAWTTTEVGTYDFGFVSEALGANEELRVTQIYIISEGPASATRDRSKVIISNTEFLRLEEDLSSFTDISDTLTSSASQDDPWDYCDFAGLLYFTNDSDNFFKYPDGANKFDQNTTALYAKTIAPYGDRLFAGNTYETSTRHRSRIQWSVIGDGDDFSGVGSGNFDLDAVPGEVIKLLPMAERANTYTGVLVAYKDTSIYHIYATGDSTDPFDYRLMDGSVGAVGVNAVTGYVNSDAQEVHAFVGKRNGELNVFEWTGNQAIPIGDPIAEDMNANANFASLDKTIVNYDPNTGLLWCGVPRSAETYPSTFYVYDIRRKLWKEHVFSENITALGQVLLSSQPTLIGGRTSGLLVKSDTSDTADSFPDSPTTIETGDFFLSENQLNYATIYRIWFWYVQRDATTITVEVSTDGGASYGTSDTVSLLGTTAGQLSLAQADLYAAGRTFRLKITDSADDDIELVKMIVEWEPMGNV